MQRLNVIPYPNSVEFTGGTVKKDVLVNNTKLTVTPGSMGDEAYRLEITSEGATALAATEKGAFYAGKTLEQLLDGEEIPCCVIKDEPAFSYRGFMIDTVRHIVSLEDTKKLIDAAASVKMNARHWHLSDDQGWRVQIDKRPLLSEKD
ncbi:MAG: family 20 glycosylhydrolase, partial [Clostridia bacterium]|nr:family 20 glycosylhydrolase [Clostridia bacterium]